MSHKTKMILTGIAFGIIVLFFSYYQFMGVQALMTLLSKQGTLIAPMIGPIFMSIELTCLLTFLFHIYTHNKHLKHIRYKSFLLRNAWFLIVSGCLALGFLCGNAIVSKESGLGSTWGYPIDMIVVSALGVAVGIGAILKSIKIDFNPRPSPDVKPTKGEQTKIIFMYILYYIFAFVAFDRVGAIIVNLTSNVTLSTIGYMIPVFAISLALVVSLNFYEIYLVLEDEKKKFIFWAISLGIVGTLSIYGIIGEFVNLLGNESSYVMKAYSQFYGLDRLIAMPVTIIFIALMVLAPLTISIVKFVKKAKTVKFEKE